MHLRLDSEMIIPSGKELPKNLFTWRQQLLEQLPEDEFDKLALANAIAWDYWLKDFQERVQAVSKRWGALEAANYVVSWCFLLPSARFGGVCKGESVS